MTPAVAAKVSGQLQKGYRVVPIADTELGGSLRMCAVVRDAADPVAGVLVLLRDSFDASIYLGCLADAGGQVHEWLELWVQNTNDLESQLEGYREALSNHTLDERWNRRAAIFARLDRSSVIELAPELAQARPIFFDLGVSTALRPCDAESGEPWELCRDDRLLEEHGLPAFSTSLARYLHVRGSEGKKGFVPVTTGAPESDATRPLAEALGPLIAFNVSGGRMMARKCAPLGFEEHLEVLAGAPWKGLEQGEKVFKLDGVYRTLQNAEAMQQGRGHLFTAKRGSAGRLVEALHLRLDLLAQAFRLVRNFTREEQLPFLNLTAASFRVALTEIGPTLPAFWTAKVALAIPGAALALPIEASEARYFIAPGVNAMSVYRPQSETRILNSTGSVRIRKVTFTGEGAVVIEGTITSRERITASRNDLLSIRLHLAHGRVDLYGNIAEGMARDELRFRTLPLKLPASLHPAIRSAEGVHFPQAPIGALPLVSSPCDLYALGVLGVRSLLVNDENPLAIAVDELLSLAQAVSGDERPLAERMHELAGSDPRWAATLGPQHLLTPDTVSSEEALACIPGTLWWEVLAALVGCFPGSVPGAVCADLGDAPPLALEAIYTTPLETFDRLLHHSRSLLFGDRKYDAEIGSVIRAALQHHREEFGAQPPA